MQIVAPRRFALNAFAVIAVGLAAISGVAYHVSFDLAIANTVENELPLAGDTVYSELQKDLIHPVLVSAEMANNGLLRDWLLDGEKDISQINRYLSEVRKKHGLVSCFLVSASTFRYYYPEGMLKIVSPDADEDAWFYRVAQLNDDFEINIEGDAANENKTTVFVNYRIYDYEGRFIGATGLGLPLARVLTSVRKYGSKFNRRILLVDTLGNIVAESEGGDLESGHIRNRPGLSTLSAQIIDFRSTESQSLQYLNPKNKKLTRVNIRYLPELGWNLILEKNDESHHVVQILHVTTPFALLTIALLGAAWVRTFQIQERHMQHKAEMLATASHDMRHFVHTLYVLLASMTHTCPSRKNVWACMEMEKVISGLDQFLARFLAYYRLDAGADRPQFSAIKLSEVLSQLTTEVAPQLDVQNRRLYVCDVPDCWVATDPVLFKVILRNFYSNAIKHAGASDIFVEALVHASKPTVKIEISNSGKSFSKPQLRQMFRKFDRGESQNKSDGVGLGLHLVAYYASKLGCRVGAHPRKHGEGTTFWVTVPLAAGSMVADAIAQQRDVQAFLCGVERPLLDKRIAVINPEPILCDLLERWGASISTHVNVDAFLANWEGREKFDGVLLDDQCLDASLKDSPLARLRLYVNTSIPVVLIGGSLTLGSADKSASFNVRHIPKPIKPAKLKLVLVRAINGT